MAVFRAVQATDMRAELRLGFLEDFGRTEITFTDASFQGVFTFFGVSTLGVFAASGFSSFPRKPGIAGTLTGFEQDRFGVTEFTVDRLDADASRAFLALRRGGTDLFQRFVFDGDDSFSGSRGADVLIGYGGDDQLWGFDGDDLLDGGRGTDVLYGLDDADALFGGSGRDWLWGGRDGDRLYGGGNRDIMVGQGGNDLLVGGRGQDNMRGCGGDDTFSFTSVADSRPGSSRRDTIRDMRDGDLIDVQRIDADPDESGNQAFVFIGNAAFTGDPGELRFDRGDRQVQGDTDGDRTADFEVSLNGSFVPGADDFIL